jgi:hypothetical protein
MGNKIEIQKLYFKRWTNLTVKILRINEVLKNCTNQNIHSYLRQYANELEAIKQIEKIETNGILNT